MSMNFETIMKQFAEILAAEIVKQMNMTEKISDTVDRIVDAALEEKVKEDDVINHLPPLFAHVAQKDG